MIFICKERRSPSTVSAYMTLNDLDFEQLKFFCQLRFTQFTHILHSLCKSYVNLRTLWVSFAICIPYFWISMTVIHVLMFNERITKSNELPINSAIIMHNFTRVSYLHMVCRFYDFYIDLHVLSLVYSYFHSQRI